MNFGALAAHEGVRLLVALGVGLLLGLERERRKGEGPTRGAAGIRTFALTSLLGGAAGVLGDAALLVAGAVFVGAAVLVAYVRGDRTDPGLTTEMALFLAYVLGACSIRAPSLAAGAGIVATALLAFRTRLHTFARTALSEQEILDGLVLGIAALVILPALPDRNMGPLDAVNPAQVWRLAVLVMAVGLASRLAVRLLGARAGVPVAGLAGGFVSSTATVGSMAVLARRDPQRAQSAAAGAVLANVSSLVQLALVVGVSSPRLLVALRWPLLAGGAAGLACALLLVARARGAAGGGEGSKPALPAVDLFAALGFAAAVTAVLIAVKFLQGSFGSLGFLVGAVGAGAADVHAAAISAADAVSRDAVTVGRGSAAVLGALTANSLVKGILGAAAGPRNFAGSVALGLCSLVAAVWVGVLLAG
jgi:uncharacterized membrane protein (DUF4010 family)